MSRNFHLIRAIANDNWFLDLGSNIDYLNAVIQGVVNSNVVAEVDSQDYAPRSSGRVAIIPIIGVLTKYDGTCGAPGMASYAALISRTISDNTVDAIVLNVDSPGGQVVGTEELANVIASSSKPIVAFVSDMACSGAYRLASSCRAIVANNNIASVGSLGVMANYTDYTAANEAKGIKVHQFYAPQSTNKNKQSRDISAGDYSSVEKELGVVADEFLSAIKSSRPSVLDDQLTGNVYFAKDVVGSLVDSIGPIDLAVTLALSLCKPKNNNMSTPVKTTKFNALTSALGVELAFLDGFTSLNEDQMEAINTALETASETAMVDSETINESSSQLVAANAQIVTLTAERDSALARITAMEAAPATKPSAFSLAADGGSGSSVASQYNAEQEAKKYL